MLAPARLNRVSSHCSFATTPSNPPMIPESMDTSVSDYGTAEASSQSAVQHTGSKTSKSSAAASVQTPVLPEHCPINSTLIVCCSTCRIIYQRVDSGTLTPCPFCKEKSTFAKQLDSELTSLQKRIAQNAEQIRLLEQVLRELQRAVDELKVSFQNSLQENEAVSDVLGHMVDVVQYDSLERKYAEIERIDTKEIISCFEGSKKHLLDVQDRLDGLISAFNAKVEKLDNILLQADEYIRDTPSTVPTKQHKVRFESNCPNDGNQTTCASRAALVVGDFSASSLGNMATKMMGNAEGLRVHGIPGSKLADSVGFCSTWIENNEGNGMVIVHSGLNDLLDSEDPSNLDTMKLSKDISTCIKELSLKCSSAKVTLVVCSIPEVVDFKLRRDWRVKAFEVNQVLKLLSSELNFKLLDVAPICSEFNTMRRDGIYYSSRGLARVMEAVATIVAPWLNVKPTRLELALTPVGTTWNNIDRRRNRLATLRGSRINVRKYIGPSHAAGLFHERPASKQSEREFWPNERPNNKHRRSVTFPDQLLSSRRKSGSKNWHGKLVDHLPPWMPGCAPWESLKAPFRII